MGSFVHEDRSDRDLIEDPGVFVRLLVRRDRQHRGHRRDRQEGDERHRSVGKGKEHDVPMADTPRAKPLRLGRDDEHRP